MSPAEADSISLACAGDIRARRRNRLLLFLLAVLVLAAAVTVFVYARQAAMQARMSQRQARQALAAAERSRERAGLQAELHAALTQLAADAAARGLAPEQWSERRINLHQQSVQRQDANDIITGTGGGDGRVFAVEGFDLSVTRPDESLFRLPLQNNQPLRMTMKGTALFGTRGFH